MLVSIVLTVVGLVIIGNIGFKSLTAFILILYPKQKDKEKAQGYFIKYFLMIIQFPV